MSTATHHFIGDSFQSVPRLQAMQSRPTLELSPLEARKRDIVDGDLCRIHNDRGETYAHAVIIEGLIPGVCVTQKQFKGSNTPGGVNVNALTSETLSDFGFAPTFYSCLAEVEKVAGPRPDLTFRNLPELAREIRTPRVVAAAGVVQRLCKLTHDTYELAVRRAAAAPEIRAHAGQYATLKFDGVSRPRPYSFARAPAREAPREHSFIIRLVPGGEVSTWLAERARIGAPVEIRGPLGRFGLDDSRRPMICIAGGSGMSAIKALLEHACDVQAGRDCYFLYGARRQRDLYCEHEIRAISALWHPDYAFRFVQVLSDEPAGSDWHGPRGLVTEYLRDHVLGPGIVDAGRCKAFVCGPPPMVNAAAAVLAAAGMDPGDVAFDRFEDASSPAPVIDNAKCVLCDECLLVKPLANCIVEAARLGVDALGRVRMTERVRPASTSGLYYNSLLIDADECIRCYACVDACPQAAIAPANAPVVRSLRQPGA